MSGNKPAAKPVQVCVQFYPKELTKIESWRKAQAGFPSRGAAVRKFVVLGLAAAEKGPPPSGDAAA
jgi:hypothetical protein